MKFHLTPLHGVHLLELERRSDARGFFARLYCEQEFAQAGLCSHFVQMNNSLNAKVGTLRGLHYQIPPDAEVKLVRCTRGAVYDVILDLRPDSPSYGQWFGAEINEDNRLMMYVPQGCAHGFITLQENTEIFYAVNAVYSPASERGIRYDDPHFGVRWPINPNAISEKDRSWRNFDLEWHGVERMRGLIG